MAMNSRLMLLLRYAMMGLDILSLNILFLVLEYYIIRIENTSYLEYTRLWIWLNLSWFITSSLGYLYHQTHLLSFMYSCRRTLHIFFFWLMLIMTYLFWNQYVLSKAFIVSYIAGFGVLLMINRLMYQWIQQNLQQSAFIVKKIMIIGYNQVAKKLATYLEEGQYTQVIGYSEERYNVSELTNYPILCSVREAVTVSKQMGVHEVYSTIAPERNYEIYRLIKEADQACIRFRIIPDLNAVVKRSFSVHYLNDIPILSLHNPQVDDPGNIIRKRIFDCIISGIVILTILSWLVPLLAVLIKLDSKGPVFFKQQRTGKNNHPFWCLKFRSMHVNGEADEKQASRDDRRLTRLGRLLRRTSLDELPQFFNVIAGNMSIVGPRPHMLKHTHDYSKVINDYMVRQFLKPGITGWAQVNGFRGETRALQQMKKRVEYDLWYLENWSLWLDVKIIFMTVFATLKGHQNAF
ncbi:MAG TPA: undecaprenyl-phosphate glucose phosphotransferase [Flavisolibacter sp.]|nr:undecaprenyl-phosphate glucose phosphotransferase [Flavisolibacter sp.]